MILGMAENLRLRFGGALATLTIDRPAKRNAISYEMWCAIPKLMAEVAASPARALVIRGHEHFSAGADISEFTTLRAGADGARRYSEAVHAGERAIAELDRPTIAAITGYCIGGGCEIALACDIRIAADDAKFGITPAKLGIVYHFTSTRQLVAAVGQSWAKQILFSGDIYDADTALRIGLVNELHTATAVHTRAMELAGRIAGRARVSVRGAKTIVNRIASGQREEDEETHALLDAAHQSAEYAEGVRAFLEKRPPRFTDL